MTDFMDSTPADIVCFCLSLVLWIAYHIFLIVKMKYHPLETSFKTWSVIRSGYIAGVPRKGYDLVGVHAIRNVIFVCVLLASKSLYIVAGFIAYTYYVDNPPVAFYILIVTISLSFLAFATSIRYLIHASFACSIPEYVAIERKKRDPVQEAPNPISFQLQHLCLPCIAPSATSPKSNSLQDPSPVDAPVIVDVTPKREIRLETEILENPLSAAMWSFFLGIRCLYSVIPVGLWIASPIAMLCGTCVVLCVMFIYDRISIDDSKC